MAGGLWAPKCLVLGTFWRFFTIILGVGLMGKANSGIRRAPKCVFNALNGYFFQFSTSRPSVIYPHLTPYQAPDFRV